MEIQVWSDIVCPFCYIGKRTLELALEQIPDGGQISVQFRSFELQPQQMSDENVSVHDMLMDKYGMTFAQAQQSAAQVTAHAERVGLRFDFSSIKQINTHDLHRLTKLAEEKGLAKELHERLFRAYFCDGQYLARHETLISIATEVGLEQQDVIALLEGKRFGPEVRQDQQTAQQLGVSGVPFFLINQKYAISGAQPISTFVQVLRKILVEQQK